LIGSIAFVLWRLIKLARHPGAIEASVVAAGA
jgi:hypothetical protein